MANVLGRKQKVEKSQQSFCVKKKSLVSSELSHVTDVTTQEIKINGDHQRGRRRACYAS